MKKTTLLSAAALVASTAAIAQVQSPPGAAPGSNIADPAQHNMMGHDMTGMNHAMPAPDTNANGVDPMTPTNDTAPPR